MEEIINITENKKKYLELLLLGDEKEEMIDRYLERGDMYVLKTPLGMALCVVTDEGDGVLELKNIAVEPVCQKKGYGRRLIRFICQKYKISSIPFRQERETALLQCRFTSTAALYGDL